MLVNFKKPSLTEPNKSVESSLGQFCFVLFCVFFSFEQDGISLGEVAESKNWQEYFELLRSWKFGLSKQVLQESWLRRVLTAEMRPWSSVNDTENMKAGITCQLFSIWIQQRRNLRAFQDFSPAEGWLFWENYRKRDKFASFLGLSHRAWPRTDGKCQEMEGLYLKKKKEARSETKPGSFCSKQWSSPGAEGWRELGWEARWAGSTQPGRWFIKQRRRKKIACNSQN